MNTLDFSELSVSGDILYRTILNYNRMEEEEYTPRNVFKPGYEWPGDIEGRTLLALVLLARSTHRTPKYLDEIISMLPDYLNEKGYFGEIIQNGMADEQQLSGNSWFLRSMVEHYLWKKNNDVYDIIVNVVNNLLLPLKGVYEKYPVSVEDRALRGDVLGSLDGNTVNGWRLSTDIGCAFNFLDGATHAYQLLKLPALKQIIDEMLEKFFSINVVELSLQTHSTLSTLRGILRYFEMVRDPFLIKKVEEIYSLYMKEAITENYENYNWFRRPEWTEPCAIIDSFIVAVGLWKNTNNPQYLKDAHNIYYNAICYSQRPNGGFGCNDCSGSIDEFLKPHDVDNFESYWCCTMRGGEGMARAIEYSYFITDNELHIPFFHNSKSHMHFFDGEAEIEQTSEYPYTGMVRLKVVSSTVKSSKKIRFFIPFDIPTSDIHLLVDEQTREVIINDGFVEINVFLKKDLTIVLSFEISMYTCAMMNHNSVQGYKTYRHGILILGNDTNEKVVGIPLNNRIINIGNARYWVENIDMILSPLNDLTYKPTESAKKNRKQILFSE